ncbi:MAG: GtrA family protein [Psychrobium sp.]
MKRIRAFGAVGGIGFIADSTMFAVLLMLSEQAMLSRIVAFWMAATVTWYGNRHLTFRDGDKSDKTKQWGKHMLAAHVAGGVNLSVFYFATCWLPMAGAFVLGIAAGLIINYLLASYFVFKPVN